MPDGRHRRRVFDQFAGKARRALEILRVLHAKRLHVVSLRAEQVLCELRHDALAAQLDLHVRDVDVVRLLRLDVLAEEIGRDRVAHFSAAILHGLHGRARLAHAREPFVHVRVRDGPHAPPDFETTVLAQLDLRQHLDVRVERERLLAEFFQRLVALQMHVRLTDRIEVVLVNRLVHGARHEVLHDLAANLILEPLAHDRARRVPLAKARHVHARGVIVAHAVVLFAHYVSSNLDLQLLARRRMVNQFRLHKLKRPPAT